MTVSSSSASVPMDLSAEAIAAARARLRERVGETGQRLGGKGTARRKVKKLHKTAVGDDKKMTQVMKRIGASNLPGIEQVQMMKADGKVLLFNNPKVQAAPAANTYIVNGVAEEKDYATLLPQILQQLGEMDNPHLDPDIIKEYQQFKANAVKNNINTNEQDKVNDDDVPELVGDNFEDVSKQ